MPAEPFPRLPFSKTADGNGNVTIPFNAPSNFYLHCYIALSASAGSPTYAVDLGGSAIPLVYGQGNQAQLGPVFLQPGEQARIVVAGAGAGAIISGQVLGWQSRAPSDLLPLLPIQPTAVAVANTLSGTLTTTASPPTLVQEVQGTPGQVTSVHVGVPVGTAMLEFLVTASNQAQESAVVTVIGSDSQQAYLYQVPPGQPPQVRASYVFRVQPGDAAGGRYVTVTIDDTAALTGTVYVDIYAYSAPSIPPPLPLPYMRWAFADLSLGAGATQQVVAGVANYTTIVYEATLETATIQAASSLYLQGAGGTRVLNKASAATGIMSRAFPGGRALALGEDLQIKNNSGGAVYVECVVGYTRA